MTTRTFTKLITLVCLLVFLKTYSQINHREIKNPIDTSYYSTGQISSIHYKENINTNRVIDCYAQFLKPCNDIEKKGELKRISKNEKGNNTTLDFFDKSFIKSTSIIKNANKFVNGFNINVGESNELKLLFSYSAKDSLLTSYTIFRTLQTENTKPSEYVYQYFNIPTEIDGLFGIQVGENHYLYIFFKKKNIIEKIFYKNLKNQHTDIYYFYSNNNLKEYGTLSPEIGRIGKWYSYYDNSQIKAIGNYNGSKFDDSDTEYDLKKDGEWLYYKNDNCIEKKEFWENGKLK